MTTGKLQAHDGKLLAVDGKLAADDGCCCPPCTDTPSCIGVLDHTAISLVATIGGSFDNGVCGYPCQDLPGDYILPYLKLEPPFLYYRYTEVDICSYQPGPGPDLVYPRLIVDARFQCVGNGTCFISLSLGIGVLLGEGPFWCSGGGWLWWAMGQLASKTSWTLDYIGSTWDPENFCQFCGVGSPPATTTLEVV